MAISGVDPKCYILALFVRDDGTRFLLGDDPYEFKDKQLHFQPNTIANDVVEVQGNDGYLLAGQVRRPGTQSFDGYVGNGTNSKAEVEAKRRDFLQFFRRSHFYKVIYVFPNGTAIQRKQGFLVDDPTVQELYQQYPEYHVALNFEDVNYYTYEEDDEGHEIYAEEAIIRLVGGGATGGLIWDENGVVWESPWGESTTVSGTDFQIDNLLPVRVPISEVELQGDTFQQTYSGKNLFDVSTFVMGGMSNGHITTSITRITNITMPLKVYPNTTYTISVNLGGDIMGFRVGVHQLDTNKDFISDSDWQQLVPNPYTFTTGPNTEFIGIVCSCSVTSTTVITGSTESGYQASSPTQWLRGCTLNIIGNFISPSPDYPQTVNVVAGTQTITVSDGGSNTQTFTIDLGATELCKIGGYQDYIYKSGGDWYVHKEIGSVSLDTMASNFIYGSRNDSYSLSKNTYLSQFALPSSTTNVYVTTFKPVNSASLITVGSIYFTGSYMHLDYDGTSTSAGLVTFQSWLSTSNTKLYARLATPTDTKITDATLVGQLEALDAMRLFIGENNILVSATSPNLPATLEFSYYTQYLTSYGAEWEEGGTKGPTIVDVNAIDNTYPVWELTGPAINPTLSVLTTNTALTYNGTITASQTLVIDMFNKTATLNGTSVIGNISGDWVYMAPGTNRVAYTAGNTDAPDSKISWQEVVG